MHEYSFKLKEIKAIQEQQIFDLLKGEKSKIDIRDLLIDSDENAEMLICYRLTDSVIKAKEVYKSWDIVEIWRWLAVKLAINYRE